MPALVDGNRLAAQFLKAALYCLPVFRGTKVGVEAFVDFVLSQQHRLYHCLHNMHTGVEKNVTFASERLNHVQVAQHHPKVVKVNIFDRLLYRYNRVIWVAGHNRPNDYSLKVVGQRIQKVVWPTGSRRTYLE